MAVEMYDRETGRVATEVIPDRTEETLSPFVKKHLLPGGTLYTDEHPAYSDFGWAGRHGSRQPQRKGNSSETTPERTVLNRSIPR